MKYAKTIVMSAVFICSLFTFIGCNNYQKIIVNFQTQAKATIDPEKLLDWAAPIIKNHEIGDDIPLDQLPSCVKTNPGVMSAEVYALSTVKGKVVFINWGNRAGACGLLIGARDYVIPKNEMDGSTKYYDWVPGVYFYLQTKS